MCDTKPKYVERDPVVLIKEDLHSFVYLDDEKLDDLSCIRQISYVGRINDSIFERQVDDGFISYFAVDVDVPFDSCASYMFSNWRYNLKVSNQKWSDFISDFKLLEAWFENQKDIITWKVTAESLKELKERIKDNPLYCYHPLKNVSEESLRVLVDLIAELESIVNTIKATSGKISEHI